jgi:hypothetical protein
MAAFVATAEPNMRMSCNGTPICRLNGNGVNRFLAGFGLPGEDAQPVPNTGDNRKMGDLMNLSLIDHFTELQTVMHGSGNEHGTLAIVSTGELPGLLPGEHVDDHRLEFVQTVDIPKAEWNQPLKAKNNKPFFPAGDVSTLSGYRIPEDIRLLGAFNLYRDASKYKMTFIWQDFQQRPFETEAFGFMSSADIQVLNNRRFRTTVGTAITLGTKMSSTFKEFIVENNPGALSFTDMATQYCSISHIPNGLFEDAADACPANPNLITNIPTLFSKFSRLISGKRPYMHYAVYFSESVRNDYYYIHEATEDHLRLPFQRVIMPAYLGYQSLVGSLDPITGDRRHYPVGFFFDGQKIPSTAKVILKPEATSLDLSYLPSKLPIIEVPSHTHDAAGTGYYSLTEQVTTTNALNTLLNERALYAPPPFYLVNVGNIQNVHTNFFTDAGYQITDQTGSPINVNNPPPCLAKSILTVPIVVDPVAGINRSNDNWDQFKIRSLPDMIKLYFDQVDGPVVIVDILATTTDYVITQPGFEGTLHIETIGTDKIFTYNGQQPGIRLPLSISPKSLWFHTASVNMDPIFENDYDILEKAVPAGALEIRIRKDWMPSMQICGEARAYFSDPALSEMGVPVTETNTEYIIKVPSFEQTAVIDISGIFSPCSCN